MNGIVVDMAVHVNYRWQNVELVIDVDTRFVKKLKPNYQPQRLVLPNDTRIVTVRLEFSCWNTPKPMILASFSNGIVTDESWNCTCIKSPSNSFSGWKNASVIGNNAKDSKPHFKRHPEIASSAKWIEITNCCYHDHVRYVSCRKAFGKFMMHVHMSCNLHTYSDAFQTSVGVGERTKRLK